MSDLLRPYQEKAASWLAKHERGYLADPPGIGKTRSAIAAALRTGCGRVAVIAPAVALAHWEREIALLAPKLRYSITSYQKYVLSHQTRAGLSAGRPCVTIFDEAHMLKHRDSRRTRELLYASFVARSDYVWPLSGTPMPRNPYELYPIVHALWPAEMGQELGILSHEQWRDRFTLWRWTDYGPKVYGAKNVAELRAFLREKMLRRTEAEVLPELGAFNWSVFPMSVTPQSAADAFSATEGVDVDELTQPDRQPSGSIASARKALGLLKAPYALDLIKQELDDSPDEKRIVFAYHRDVLALLRAGFDQFGVAYIDGSTSLKDRNAAERAFQTDPSVRVFLGQNEAAGLSLTLTAAHRVDLVEPDWRTDMNVQDGKRAHRIGQEHPVHVRMLSMADTLDEHLVAQHWREARMRAEVIE